MVIDGTSVTSASSMLSFTVVSIIPTEDTKGLSEKGNVNLTGVLVRGAPRVSCGSSK